MLYKIKETSQSYTIKIIIVIILQNYVYISRKIKLKLQKKWPKNQLEVFDV